MRVLFQGRLGDASLEDHHHLDLDPKPRMELLNQWIVPPEATGGAGLYIGTALLALLITAISKGGFGGGVGMVSVPLMLQVAPPQFVIGLWLPYLIACDLATIRQYPKEWSLSAVSRLLPGMLLGITVATLFLGGLSKEAPSADRKIQDAWLKFAVAFVAVAFVALKYLPLRYDPEKSWRPTWTVSLPLGLFAGITTMVAHAAGPLLTMYLLPQRLDKRTFVGTCGRFFFFFNTLKVPFYLAIGWIAWPTLKYGLWMILLAAPGVWLGSWFNRRLSPTWFVRLTYLFLVLAAIKLVYDWLRAPTG